MMIRHVAPAAAPMQMPTTVPLGSDACTEVCACVDPDADVDTIAVEVESMVAGLFVTWDVVSESGILVWA